MSLPACLPAHLCQPANDCEILQPQLLISDADRPFALHPTPSAPAVLQLGAAGLMDQGVAQRLFGFTGFEAFHDVRSDTRALLSWRDGLLLLAFRGTASAANALTDVKAWQVPVLPRRYHSGRLVKVHAGERGKAGWALRLSVCTMVSCCIRTATQQANL